MTCSQCKKSLEEGATFCPYCGFKIEEELQETVQETVSQNQSVVTQYKPSVKEKPLLKKSADILVMRVVEEQEEETKPGEKRPILIMDEEVVHLSHTDKKFEPEELYSRVTDIIQRYEVPVDIQLVNTRWLKDKKEVRPRLVASLSNHTFSDIKMFMGVDYMGRWASIQLSVGYEPEPIPPTPKWSMPTKTVSALVIGFALIFLGAFIKKLDIISVIGFIVIIYGGWTAYKSYKEHTVKLIKDRTKQEFRKATERLSRTFKNDDMRLFSTAMREVFYRIVDDIVQKGAEIVRIEGGQGGIFKKEGIEALKPTSLSRKSDAAQAEI